MLFLSTPRGSLYRRDFLLTLLRALRATLVHGPASFLEPTSS